MTPSESLPERREPPADILEASISVRQLNPSPSEALPSGNQPLNSTGSPRAHETGIAINKLLAGSRLGAPDQFRLAQQALAQIRESVVITKADLDLPGPEIVYVNHAFTVMTGYQPEEVIGKTPRILQGPKTNRKVREKIRSQLSKGESFEGEDINYRKDGTEFAIDWYIEPLHDENGAIAYWVAVQRDMTEKRQLEAQLLHAQRLEGIGMLASGIAHDLNNVLSPILLGAECLPTTVTDAASLELIELMGTAALRGANLVKQILSFARGITGEAGCVQPLHIIKEIVSVARETFPKDITITHNVDVEPWLVELSAMHVHQVLLNLSVNARDAIQDVGVITLDAENLTLTEPLRTQRDTLSPGDYVVLTVADSGSGIPAEIVERIFDPFFSTKAPGKGTGLGLSTVAMIVKSAGGSIDIESSLARGTKFSVYLPAAPEPKAPLRDSLPKLRAAGAGQTVLVVEDEEAILQVARETLQSAGYAVQTANGPEQALRACETAWPDVALVDLMMPGGGGAPVVRELRARDAGLPVIVMSGLSEDEAKAAAPEASGFLQKPFTLAKLFDTVREALALSH